MTSIAQFILNSVKTEKKGEGKDKSGHVALLVRLYYKTVILFPYCTLLLQLQDSTNFFYFQKSRQVPNDNWINCRQSPRRKKERDPLLCTFEALQSEKIKNYDCSISFFIFFRAFLNRTLFTLHGMEKPLHTRRHLNNKSLGKGVRKHFVFSYFPLFFIFFLCFQNNSSPSTHE